MTGARHRRMPLWASAVLVAATGCVTTHRMERVLPEPPGACPSPGPPARGGSVVADSTLVWYRAASERDVELAARWCATVGTPVVRLHPSGGGGRWSSGDSLEVVSWNMWIGGGDLLRLLMDELDVDCRRGGRGAAAAAPFVVLLQEAWRYSEDLPVVRGRSRIIPWTIDPDGARADDPDVVEAARRCGLALVYVPSARNGPDDDSRPHEDKGNAILSNLPLTNPIAFDLPLEGGRKVAVAATVRTPAGRSVRVVSLHLDVASTLVRTVFTGNRARVRQAMGLVDGLARAERDGYGVDATVVGADMNTWASNETALRRMRAAFPASPAWDRKPTRGVLPTDHIFFRSETDAPIRVGGYTRLEERYGSDHHPRRLFVVSSGGSR